MSVANNSLRVSELNFFQTKQNLKDYLAQTPEFYDYNFDSSTLSRILDVLAYNTYNGSFYLNMVGNEMFLDSATRRPNVVSRAKELGYVPASMKSAYTNLAVTIIPNDSPVKIVIPKYTQFSGTTDTGGQLIFTNFDDYVLTSSNGITFTGNIQVFEGNILQYKFVYGSTNSFEIPNPNLDTSSLRVYVKESDGSTVKVQYTLVTDITEINADSKVFYLEENSSGNFNIYFGDDVLGSSLSSGNVIFVEGRFCNGVEGNDLTNITNVSHVGYNNDIPTTTYEPTSLITFGPTAGGADKESQESIQFLAPKYFTRQLRNVTSSDYQSYILENFRDVESVAAWGGENHDPPYYGKIIVACKPTTGFVLSNSRKNEIKTQIQKFNVQTVDPILIDPIFTYINLDASVTYSSDKTVLTSSNLLLNLSNAVTRFEELQLGTFGQPFYISKFSNTLTSIDKSILDIEVEYSLEKRLVPIFNSTVSYKLSFSEELQHAYDGALGCITSEEFKLTNFTKTTQIDDDGYGNIRLFYRDDNYNKVYLSKSIGTVDYVNGNVILNGFNFQSLPTGVLELKIHAIPLKKTYKPQNNEILLLSTPTITLIDDNKNNLQVGKASPDVLGNDSPIRTNSILSPVIL